MGAHLNAYTAREQTVYYARCFKQDTPSCVEIISDILQNSKFEESAIEREREVILREQEEVDKQYEEVVFDHLHATAFPGQPLGRTILGPKENILSIKRNDLVEYINKNYRADRMVLVSAGGVPHEEVVKLAEKHFGKIPPSGSYMNAQKATPRFVGSEIRIRDDTMQHAHIALAVEGVGHKHPDYWTMLVMQAIVGNWDRALGSAPHLGSRFSSIVAKNGLANSFMSFSTSYSDTGLWGIYLVTENRVQMDDLVHFCLRVQPFELSLLTTGMVSIVDGSNRS
jgi:mitochondrial-processing peptidase subunit beta